MHRFDTKQEVLVTATTPKTPTNLLPPRGGHSVLQDFDFQRITYCTVHCCTLVYLVAKSLIYYVYTVDV